MVKVNCFACLFPRRSREKLEIEGNEPDSAEWDDDDFYKEIGRFSNSILSLPSASAVMLQDDDFILAGNVGSNYLKNSDSSFLKHSIAYIDKLFEFQNTQSTINSSLFDDTRLTENFSQHLKVKNIEKMENSEEKRTRTLTEKLRCSFCGKEHFPEQCLTFETFGQRFELLRNRSFPASFCFFCGCSRSRCSCPRHCNICFGKHHISLCPQRFIRQPQRDDYPSPAINITSLDGKLIKRLFEMLTKTDKIKLYLLSKKMAEYHAPEPVTLVNSLMVNGVCVLDPHSQPFVTNVEYTVKLEDLEQFWLANFITRSNVEFRHFFLDCHNCQYLNLDEFIALTPIGLNSVKISKCKVIPCPSFDQLLQRFEYVTFLQIGIRNLNLPRNWARILMAWDRKVALNMLVLEFTPKQLEKATIRHLVAFIKMQQPRFQLIIKTVIKSNKNYKTGLTKDRNMRNFVRNLKSYFFVINKDKQKTLRRKIRLDSPPVITIYYQKATFNCFWNGLEKTWLF